MSDLSLIRSQEAAFDFLDTYAIQQRAAIKQQNLNKETGIIKSYMIETESHDEINIPNLFVRKNWEITPLEEGFYRFNVKGEDYGFIETVSSRHLALHTIQRSAAADKAVQMAVRGSSQLDFVWLSGHYLNMLWDAIIKPQRPERYIKFKFEYIDLFRNGFDDESLEPDDEFFDGLDESNEADNLFEYNESKLTIGMKAKKIAAVLPDLQKTLPDFEVMRMLRLPAAEKIPGGYEFWHWGKISYRSPSFRDGRTQLYSVIELYQKVTELIEERTWFQAELNKLPGIHESITLTGTPISFIFRKPLETTTFKNFVKDVFDKKQKYFRIWGNPIFLDEYKVHVYGLDMHLWQKIYLELTPSRFILVLPKDTCGNTVHRLISNIQGYLSPSVEVYIGDTRYEDLIFQVLLGER